MQNLIELFQKQKSYIDKFFSSIDQEMVKKAAEQIIACQGIVFFSGVGKSGIIAEKLAMTMISIGKKAMFLPPTNALHGDIGTVSAGDVFIFLSKSGESHELLELIPFLKQRDVTLQAWVCSKQSTLSSKVDLSVYLHLEKELCPFGLAPTTSTAIQLIFGDILAVYLMQHKRFSLEDYAKNHPGGLIGKKTLKVKDVMLTKEALPICRVSQKLKETLSTLSEKKCGCLVVVDDDHHIQGIFTDGDLRRALEAYPNNLLEMMMDSLMTKSFLKTQKNTYVQEAINLMQKDRSKWVSVLPVTDGQKLVGLLRMHDAIHVNYSEKS